MLEGKLLRVADRPWIEVAGSTSNLGPGFDLLGLALSLRLEVSVLEPARGAECELVLAEDQARDWPPSPENLLPRAFERAFRTFGGRGGAAVRFAVRSEIPVGRGLGSSAAAIVAGLLLGAALAPGAVERADLLRLALELEGHPDNVAPALYGGCVIAVPREGRAPRIVRQELHPSLGFALAWPERPFATSLARGLLPRQVPFADAVENPRRLALLLEGLRSGDPELLALGSADRLHVPYRLPHIPGAQAAIESGRAAGAWMATLSGSGSAVLAIAARERAHEVAQAMAAGFRAAGERSEARVVAPFLEAPSPRASS